MNGNGLCDMLKSEIECHYYRQFQPSIIVNNKVTRPLKLRFSKTGTKNDSGILGPKSIVFACKDAGRNRTHTQRAIHVFRVDIEIFRDRMASPWHIQNAGFSSLQTG